MGRAAPRRVRIGRASPARQQNKCACRRSARPSIGDGRDHKDTTRAQKRAAGTKKAALFDIVNRERCERRIGNGALEGALFRPGARSPHLQSEEWVERDPKPIERAFRAKPEMGFAQALNHPTIMRAPSA